MSDFPLTQTPATDANIKVGDLNTPNNKEKFLPPFCKTVWEDKKIRKHTDGGGRKCLWCGFKTITNNHTTALSPGAKVKIIGVNVSLCVVNISDYLLARYGALLKKNMGKNSAKNCAQEQVNQDINKLQETGSNVLSAKKYQKYSSSSQSPPAPLQRSHSPFQTISPGKIQDRQQGLEDYVRPYSSDGGGGTIYGNNEVNLDMEITDLSHDEAIPFNIGESNRFRKSITLARIVGPDYCPHNRNMIGGELLDLNWRDFFMMVCAIVFVCRFIR